MNFYQYFPYRLSDLCTFPYT